MSTFPSDSSYLIDNNDVVAAREQSVGNPTANESSRARYQNFLFLGVRLHLRVHEKDTPTYTFRIVLYYRVPIK